MSQLLNPASLPPEARITLNQTAAIKDGQLDLSISGTGWIPPDFSLVNWSEPITLTPVGPVPGNPASVTGRFDFTVSTNFDTQQVDWSISSVELAAGEEPQADDQSEITVSLLDKGWSILRSMNGTAIPMMAYSKRQVTASGTGLPPVTASPLSEISFLGINILVTEYTNNTVAKTWSIAGEEQ